MKKISLLWIPVIFTILLSLMARIQNVWAEDPMNAFRVLGFGEAGTEEYRFGMEKPVKNAPEEIFSRGDAENRDRIVMTATGRTHSLLLNKSGQVWVCGTSEWKAHGSEVKTLKNFKKFRGLEDKKIVQIAAGNEYSLFVTDNGDLWGCGLNDQGQLGLKDVQTFYGKPELIFSRKQVIKVKCGRDHSLFLTSDGQLWGMGRSENGQLG